MSDAGIRVELSVDTPGACPVASLVEESGTVTDVVRSRPQADGQIAEEFTVSDTEVDDTVDEVFETTDGSRYRTEREQMTCPCEIVETGSGSVSEVRIDGDRVTLTFHAPDVSRTQAIVSRLNDRFDAVSLRSLQQHGHIDTADAVLVDRSRLTDRQREVLETAVEMGYFEYPKGANAGEVATALDISVSTFAEHVAAALSKLLDPIVEE